MAHTSSVSALIQRPNHSARLFNPMLRTSVALSPFHAEADLEVVVRTP